jgi:hypothetical protein
MSGAKVFGFFDLVGRVTWTREWAPWGWLIRATSKDYILQQRPDQWIDKANELLEIGDEGPALAILAAIRDMRVVTHDFKPI